LPATHSEHDVQAVAGRHPVRAITGQPDYLQFHRLVHLKNVKYSQRVAKDGKRFMHSIDAYLGSGGAHNLKTVMGASTSKGMAHKGIRSSRQSEHVHSSNARLLCSDRGHQITKQRHDYTHREIAQKKVTEQYIDRNRACILRLTEH